MSEGNGQISGGSGNRCSASHPEAGSPEEGRLFLAALIAVVCLCVPLIIQMQDERGQIGKNYTTAKPGAVVTIPVTEPR